MKNVLKAICMAINLQLFADASTVENKTTDSGMSTTMKTFYDTELLENARAELFHTQFAKTQGLPANNGKTVEWRKWNTLPNASALTEGVIPSGEKFGQSSQNSSIGQYGIYVTVTDQLELHALDNVIVGATEELGASAGSTEDVLARNTLVAGSNVLYAPSISGGTVTAVTARIGLTANSKLTPDMVNKAVTALKKLKAPKINGKYVATIHPSVAYDLRSSDEWVEAHKYAATTELFNGEIGELHGCRFVETTEAKIWRGADLTEAARDLTVASWTAGTKTAVVDEAITTEEAAALAGRYVIIKGEKSLVASATAGAAGAAALVLTAVPTAAPADGEKVYPGEGGAAGVAVYASLFLGKNAYGIIDPDGAGLEMIIHSKDEVGGPLNQFSTVGYKMSTASKILYEDRIERVESGSAFSSDDVAN